MRTLSAQIVSAVTLLSIIATSSAAQVACVTNVAPGPIPKGTWTSSGSPYCVTGNIRVSELTIEAGVEVLVAGPYRIDVLSAISVAGTSESPVRFASYDPAGRWAGFRFENTPDGSSFVHGIFENASGSAVTLVNAAGLLIDHCTFRNNTNLAASGGALFADGITTLLDIRDSHFIENVAPYNAGALRLRILPGGSARILRSEFRSNSTDPPDGVFANAGGAIWVESGNLTIDSCVFASNNAHSRAIAPDCCWQVAQSFSYGGALYITNGSVAVRRSVFLSNHAYSEVGGPVQSYHDPIGYGGAIYLGDGALTIDNSVLGCNSVDWPGGASNGGGAGVWGAAGSIRIVNSTIAENNKSGVGKGGGSAEVRNSVVFFNASGGAQLEGDVSVAYSNVQQAQGIYPGVGNINVNPVFIGPGCEDGAFDLDGTSPSIDRGDPATGFQDECFPPSQGGLRDDQGHQGGPLACPLSDPITSTSTSTTTSTSTSSTHTGQTTSTSTSSTTTTRFEPCQTRGDCNCDGKVNGGDRLCVIAKFFDASLRGTCDCEDCNLDNSVNAPDSTCVTLCSFDSCPAVSATAP